MVSAVIETPIYMLNHKNKVYIAFPCRIQYLRINGSSHEFQFVDSRWRVDCTSITSGAKNVSEFTTQVVSLIIYHYSARVAEPPFSNFQRAMGLHRSIFQYSLAIFQNINTLGSILFYHVCCLNIMKHPGVWHTSKKQIPPLTMMTFKAFNHETSIVVSKSNFTCLHEQYVPINARYIF